MHACRPCRRGGGQQATLSLAHLLHIPQQCEAWEAQDTAAHVNAVDLVSVIVPAVHHSLGGIHLHTRAANEK